MCIFIAQAIWIGVRGSRESETSAPDETAQPSEVNSTLPAKPVPPTTLAGKTCDVSGIVIPAWTMGRLCDGCLTTFHLHSLENPFSSVCPKCGGHLMGQSEIDARYGRPKGGHPREVSVDTSPPPDTSTLSGRIRLCCIVAPYLTLVNVFWTLVIMWMEGHFSFVFLLVMPVFLTVGELALCYLPRDKRR